MPAAWDGLRAKFPGDDAEAWEVLKENFDELAGMIFPKVSGYEPTERENDAIDYLFYEWDYGYTPLQLVKFPS